MEATKPIPQTCTEYPALKYLYRYVRNDIANDWYEIGIELFDVEDQAILDTIKNNYGDASKCAAEMLRLWLSRKPEASWNQLLDTLREPGIKLNALAAKIEGMLSKDSEQPSSSSAKKAKTTGESSDSHILEDGYKVDFKACRNVSIAFTKLFSRFQKAINTLNYDDFCVVRDACVVQAKEPLCSSLQRASDGRCLFKTFSENNMYFNWIHLSFLEIVANSYVNDSLVSLIEDYKQAIFSKSLREVWSSLPHSLVKDKIDNYYSELTQKLEGKGRNPDDMTVQQLLNSEPKLTMEIALLLAVVQEKSLLISWLIPTDQVYQAYLSFLTVPQQERIDNFIQFGNWIAHLPGYVLQEEYKRFACLERLSTSTVLIGYYHGLLLRDTNADVLINHLYHKELLLTHEQEMISSGHSLHRRNWLLLEHVRHMNPSSLLIFSKLINDLWPQIGIQLVTALASLDDDSVHAKVKEDRVIIENFNAHFSYIDPSSVLTVFFQISDSVVKLLTSCHVKVLVDVCENLMASDKYAVKFFSDYQMKKLKTSDSSFVLLQKLSLLFTWSNHSILRVLADQCSEAVNILDNFDCRVNSLEPIAFYPIPYFSLNMIPIDTSTHTILAIRCDQELYKSTLQYVYDMQSVVMDKCDITQHCLQLLAVRNSPTILYWTIPKCIVYLIHTTVPQHSEYLYSRGILEVWVYQELQRGHVSVGSLAFDDPKLVETKYGVQENENSESLRKHVEHLKADKIILEEQLEDLNTKLQTEQILSRTNKQLHEKMTDIKLENAQLNDRNDRLKLDLLEITIKMAKLKELHYDDVEQLKADKITLEEQLKDLNTKFKTEQILHKQLHKELHEKMIDIKLENAQLNNQNHQLKLDLQETTTKKMAVLKELQSSHYVVQENENSESLRKHVEHLKADKIILEEQLEDLNTKLQTEQILSRTNKQLHEKMTDIKLENAQLNDRNDQLKLDLQEITNKMAKLKELHYDDVEQLKADKITLEEQLKNLNTEFKTEQILHKQLHKQLHEEMIDIKLENAQLNNQNDQLKLDLQETTTTKKMAALKEVQSSHKIHMTNHIEAILLHSIHVDGPYQINCDGQTGGSFAWSDCGLELTFPPKCAQQNIQVTMSAFLPVNQEVHPGVYIVSAVYKFDCNIKHFDIPFILCLQHCVKLESPEDCRKMQFFPQHGDNIDIKHGNFEIGKCYGTLNLNRFCVKCITYSTQEKNYLDEDVLPNQNDHNSETSSASSQPNDTPEINSDISHESPSGQHNSFSTSYASVDVSFPKLGKTQEQIESLPWSYEWMLALPKDHLKLPAWNGIYSVYINLRAWRKISVESIQADKITIPFCYAAKELTFDADGVATINCITSDSETTTWYIDCWPKEIKKKDVNIGFLDYDKEKDPNYKENKLLTMILKSYITITKDVSDISEENCQLVVKGIAPPLQVDLCSDCYDSLTILGTIESRSTNVKAGPVEVADPTYTGQSLHHTSILQQEPEMADLNYIVIPRIKAEWEDVAYALHYKIVTVNAIKEKHNENPKKCCRELFIDWLLTNHGVGPKTWSTLLDKLKEVEGLSVATQEIIKELEKFV